MITTALSLVLLGQPTEMRLLQRPDIHGETVVFTYAGDLWTMDRRDGVANRLTSHPSGEAFARFSPDGEWIAFTGGYDGNSDVYVIPTKGGEPKRLTYEGTADIVLDWTPDGRIAYGSSYGNHTERTMRLWTVSPKGGMPRRTAIAEVAEASYSPDGKTLVYNRTDSAGFSWRRYRGGTQGRISFYEFDTNKYWQVPSGRENSYAPMWIGNAVYYVSDRNDLTRNLFRYDVASKKSEALTQFKDADIANPGFDGKTIVYERGGYLETFDVATRKVERLKARVDGEFLAARPRLRSVAEDVRGMTLSPSGVRIAVDARGDIFSVPARNGETRNMTNTQGVRETAPAWSPDGKTIAYLSDEGGETGIWTQPQMGGKATRLATDGKHVIRSFGWSPDGSRVAYTTARSELYLFDLATGAASLVYREDLGGTPGYDFSADGTWLAYTKNGGNLFGALYLYDVEAKKSHKITDGYFSDETPTFDMTGKYLYFLSSRTFSPAGSAFEFMMTMDSPTRAYYVALSRDATNPMIAPSDEEKGEDEKPSVGGGPGSGPAEPGGRPRGPRPGAGVDDETWAQPADAKPADTKPTETKPADAKPEEPKPAPKPKMKVDIEGMADRVMPLPWPAGDFRGIAGVSEGVLAFTGEGINLFSFASRTSSPIYQGPLLGGTLNAKRTKGLFRTPQGMVIADLRPGGIEQGVRVGTAGLEMNWDPRAEWKQIFWEGWRWQRDVFYDPAMLGLDWDAIGKKYAELLPYVRHRRDLNVILGMMIGELGTGHAYVGGGDVGATMGGARPGGIGHLGADYEIVGGKVRFGRIYRGLNFEEGRRGPLGEPGVNVSEGDYLLEINGQAVTADTNLHSYLAGKAGQYVTLTVNSSPAMTGSRKVRVRPIGDEGQLRYISWVEANRKYVAEKTGGRVGYLHIPDTSIPGVVEFIKGFYSQTDKEAWILDERYNGGGMIPTFFIEFLQRQVFSGFKARDQRTITFPTGALNGPKAMLINEYAGSGGDMLPWLFRRAKIGPLIGNRTWGGLVGIQGSAPLVDGGFLTSPGFGIFDADKGEWIAENVGVDPDIPIDLRPDLFAKGQDPQLDKAIEHLLNELKSFRREYKEPAFPRVVR